MPLTVEFTAFDLERGVKIDGNTADFGENLKAASTLSQAISLKRIADALELLAKPDPLADLNWQDWTPTEDQPKPLIPPGLQVAICARGGWKAAISLERTAALDWSHSNNPGDIVAYAIMPG